MSMTADTERLALAWLDAFNRHDVDSLVSLYAEDATHTSPKLRAQHPETGGRIQGRENLRAWWKEANTRLPGLRYELTHCTPGARSVVLEYLRHAPGQPVMPVAEVFEVREGRIVASRVYHG